MADEPLVPTGSDPDWTLRVEQQAGACVLVLAGELDLATAPAFESEARARLADGPVVLDLEALRFLDSSGLRALDRLLAAAGEHGTSLRRRPAIHPNAEQTLRLAGLLDALPVDPTPRPEERP